MSDDGRWCELLHQAACRLFATPEPVTLSIGAKPARRAACTLMRNGLALLNQVNAKDRTGAVGCP